MTDTSRFAGLTTRGRCLLAGGGATAACAVVLDERDLLRIGVFGALLPLLALLLATLTRRTVRVDRDLSPARLAVGGAVEVSLHLHGGALLGALRLADTVPDGAGPQPSAPPRFTVHRLARRRSAVMGYPLRPLLRGVHRVGPLVGSATDPLGLTEFERELTGAATLLVLPRVVALYGLPTALGAGEGAPGAAPTHQGHGASDVLIRPYRYGDELRRVHWRSTARHDDLMVRQEERPWRGSTTVLLDRRDSAHRGRGPDSSLEFAVSLTASICAHLIARGEPLTLITEDGTLLAGPDTRPRIDPLLDALAALHPSARVDLAGAAPTRGTAVLAVLGTIGPGQVESLLARHPTGGHAVLLDTATWDTRSGDTAAGRSTTAGTASALRNAGWRVTVATAGSAPERVWDDLISGSAPDPVRAEGVR